MNIKIITLYSPDSKIVTIRDKDFRNITINDEREFLDFYNNFVSVLDGLYLDKTLSKRFRKQIKKTIDAGVFDEVFISMYERNYGDINIERIFSTTFIKPNYILKFFGSNFKDKDYIKLNLTLKHLMHPLITLCYQKDNQVNEKKFCLFLNEYSKICNQIDDYSKIKKRNIRICNTIKNNHLCNVDVLLESALPKLDSFPELYDESLLLTRKAYEIKKPYEYFSDFGTSFEELKTHKKTKTKNKLQVILEDRNEDSYEEVTRKKPSLALISSEDDLRTPTESSESKNEYNEKERETAINSTKKHVKFLTINNENYFYTPENSIVLE